MTRPARTVALIVMLSSSAAVAKHRRPAKHVAAPKHEKPPKPPPPPPKTFPSPCEIDGFLGEAPSMTSTDRVAATVTLITRMVTYEAPTAEDGVRLWSYFLQRWVVLFRVSGFMDMLEAVDQAPQDTKFSLAECATFYRGVLHDTRAVEYYRYREHRGRLALCFEPEELERLLALPVPGGRDRPRGLTRVSACDADQFVASIAEGGGMRARRVEEMVEQAGLGADGDALGASYLLTRLGQQFRAHPDEAILAGFDSATRFAPDLRVCELYAHAVQAKPACAAFKEHYKAPAALPAKCLSDDVKRCFAE
jgi:hypothetical protein